MSPYLTHGFVSLPDVLAGVTARHRGEGILQSLHEGPLPDRAYEHTLPDDIRQARTGVPAIDMAVRTLYATGLLHIHARMWLASYVVHLRKVHWRAGADWLYRHLLDGDLASNHLSWQWVAGTGSRQPCLFNAGNVVRYAGGPWHSPGSVIDVPYATLDRIAHGPPPVAGGPAPRADGRRLAEPGFQAEPPAALAAARRVCAVDEPHLLQWLARWAERQAAPQYPSVDRRCDSFSQWWTRATHGLQSADELLAVNEVPTW